MARDSKTTFIVLHGFLGDTESFAELKKMDVIYHPIDLRPLTHNFCAWDKLIEQVTEQIKAVTQERTQVCLMGYSMGGRLLLECLKNLELNKYQQIFLISSHLGFYQDDELEKKRGFDSQCLKILKNGDVDGFLEFWNNLELFKADPIKSATSWNYNEIAHGLTHWTQAQEQDFLINQKYHDKFIYAYGQLDNKYRNQGVRFKERHPGINLCELKGRGHRLLSRSDLAKILDL